MTDSINSEFFDLSLIEFAILEFTNEGTIGILDKVDNVRQTLARKVYESRSFRKHNKRTREPLILTTKDTYTWASLIANLIDKNPNLGDDEFINAYKYAINLYRDVYKRAYKENIFITLDGPDPTKVDVCRNFCQYFITNHNFHNKLYYESNELSKKAIKSLQTKGLIDDPIFTNIFGIAVAVIGFLPIGFTQRKRKGKTIYRKIQALFWTYEMQEINGSKITNVYFRLWKILRTFKAALAEEMDELVESSEEIKENKKPKKEKYSA